MAAAGVGRVDPAAPAPAFELPRLSGGVQSLAKLRGKPVLVHFWATWCGPCVSELPELDAFYKQAGGGKRFELLAISSEPRETVEAFVKQRGIGMPVLLDEDQTVASQYQASALPTTFFIDKHGKLAGVARGARPWRDARLAGVVEALVTGKAPAEALPAAADATAPAGPAPAPEPPKLPPGMKPPRAVTSIDPAVPAPGKPFSLKLRLEWDGALDDYALGPPELALPAGLTVGAIESTGGSTGGNVLVQTVALTADKPGDYVIEPRLRFVARAVGAPMEERAPKVTFSVRAPTILGVAPLAAAGMGGGALVGLCGGIFAARALVRRRARRAEASRPPPDERAATFARLSTLRDQADLGDLDGLMPDLVALARALDPETLGRQLGALDERVRYAGHRPSREDLAAMIRQLELIARMRFPDAQGTPTGP